MIKRLFFFVIAMLSLGTALLNCNDGYAAEIRELEVPPQGDVFKNRDLENRQFSHSDLFPTGIFLKKGEKMTVSSNSLDQISVVIGQIGTYEYLNDNQEIPREEVQLVNNTQVIESTYGDGIVYIRNRSDAKDAQVTIEGGEKVPFFIKGETSDEEFHQQIEALSDAPFIQVLGDYTMVNFQYPIVSDILKNRSVKELTDYLDDVVLKTEKVYGLQRLDNPINSKKNLINRVLFETPDKGGGYAYATNGYVGFQKNTNAMRDLAALKKDSTNWGIWHEVGHTYQTPQYQWNGMTEVTVNISSTILEEEYGIPDSHFYKGSYEVTKIKSFLDSTDPNKSYDGLSEFIRLGLFKQLYLTFGDNFYPRLSQEIRDLYTNNFQGIDEFENYYDKKQFLIREACLVTQRDLRPFFKKWGIIPTKITNDFLDSQKLNELDKNIWENLYADPTNYTYDLPEYSVANLDQKMNHMDFLFGTEISKNNVLFQASSYPIESKSFVDSIGGYPTSTKNGEAILKARLSNELNVHSTLFFPVRVKRGNLLSIGGNNGTQERVILSLNHKNNKIDAIENTACSSSMETGTGEYARVELYDSEGNLLNDAVINCEETPQNFVKKLDTFTYSDGNYLRVKTLYDRRIHTFKNDVTDVDSSNSAKEEWFVLKDNQFNYLGKNAYLPKLSVKSIKANIGDLKSPEEFIESKEDIFGKEDLKAEFITEPDTSYNHTDEVEIKVTNKLGYWTKQKATIDVHRKDEVSIFGWNSDQERIFIRTTSDGKKLLSTSSSLYKTSIEGGTGLYATVQLYDGQVNLKKELTLNCEDNPAKIVEKLNQVSISEGDLLSVEVKNHSGRIQSYENGENKLVQKDSKENEWFCVKNGKLVYLKNNTPFPSADTRAVSVSIGQTIMPKDFIKAIHSYYDENEIKVEFLEKPDNTKVGKRNIEIKLTSPKGFSSSYWVEYNISHWNDLTLYGYQGNQERIHVALQTKNQTLSVVKDSTYNTPMDVGSGVYFDFTQYDKNYHEKCNQTINAEDKPDNFVQDLNGKTYEEGDLIQVKSKNVKRLTLYRQGMQELKPEDSLNEEWFEVKNDELVYLGDSSIPDVFNYFKLGYWKNYGFILEGEANEVGKTFAKNDVLKTVELVDSSNQVVESFDGANTNWYDTSTYSGYQAILTKKKLGELKPGSYKVQVRVKTANFEFVLPVSQKEINNRSYVTDYQDQIDKIPSDSVNESKISFENVSGQMQLTVSSNKNVVNRLSFYHKNNKTILDAWIAADTIDFREKHTKELVIEDAQGKEVVRRTVATWDISKTFGVQVKEEWEKSGFQLSLTPEELADGNKLYVVMKDQSNVEKLKVQVF